MFYVEKISKILLSLSSLWNTFLALTFEVELGKELFFQFSSSKKLWLFRNNLSILTKVRFVDKYKMANSKKLWICTIRHEHSYTTMEAFLRSERLMRKCMSDNFLGLSGEK